MWFRGDKAGVPFWYVYWGAWEGSKNIEAYMTLNGLVKWVINDAYREVPVYRLGRVVFTEEGPEEKESWTRREEFLEWARPLVGFEIP